jgi:hypothetical protein
VKTGKELCSKDFAAASSLHPAARRQGSDVCLVIILKSSKSQGHTSNQVVMLAGVLICPDWRGHPERHLARSGVVANFASARG